MNCKPGDLAVIVRKSKLIGLLVNVVGPALDGELGVWTVEPLRPIPCPAAGGWKCADHNLRPIRDPGEDARDETLNWLPVPTKELA
jgi:hypothetical protein